VRGTVLTGTKNVQVARNIAPEDLAIKLENLQLIVDGKHGEFFARHFL
jgi:hypothetical protein